MIRVVMGQFMRGRLKRNGRHIEQQLTQMRATQNAAQTAFNGLSPATPHGATHHGLHRVLRLGALLVRHTIHGNGNGPHNEFVVKSDTDGEIM